MVSNLKRKNAKRKDVKLSMANKGKKIPSAKIKGLRAERGMSQADLAKIIGITAGSLQLKEDGKYDWKSSEMFTMRRFFKVSLDELFPA